MERIQQHRFIDLAAPQDPNKQAPQDSGRR